MGDVTVTWPPTIAAALSLLAPYGQVWPTISDSFRFFGVSLKLLLPFTVIPARFSALIPSIVSNFPSSAPRLPFFLSSFLSFIFFFLFRFLRFFPSSSSSSLSLSLSFNHVIWFNLSRRECLGRGWFGGAGVASALLRRLMMYIRAGGINK